MTEQEAIKWQEAFRKTYNGMPEEANKACDMAISALEEIQKYREIDKERGNVLKRLLNGEWVDTKDVEKYLNIDFSDGMKLFKLSRTAEWNPPPLNGQKIKTKFRLKNKELEEYRALGTIEELREAREKQVPKKPRENTELIEDISFGLAPWTEYYCPCCETLLKERQNYKYCYNCGQSISWE